MSLLWKKYRITFELPTKDNQWFRYATVEFEQKRNFYWLISEIISENMSLHICVLNHIRQWFKLNIDFNYVFEEENPQMLIDDSKLKVINSKLNTLWKLDWQSELPGKIRNIEIIYLIR